jgi:hypothetical protein
MKPRFASAELVAYLDVPNGNVDTGDVQANLFGTLSRTEERRLQDDIAATGRTCSFDAQKERALLEVVHHNPYQRALLLIQMAPFHDVHEQARPGSNCLGHALRLICGVLQA